MSANISHGASYERDLHVADSTVRVRTGPGKSVSVLFTIKIIYRHFSYTKCPVRSLVVPVGWSRFNLANMRRFTLAV
jgi:hypothetical protein